MIERLREAPDAMGLVASLSGLLNKPGLAVYAAEPGLLLVADLAEDAAQATESVDAVGGYRGPATIAAATVNYLGLFGFSPPIIQVVKRTVLVS